MYLINSRMLVMYIRSVSNKPKVFNLYEKQMKYGFIIIPVKTWLDILYKNTVILWFEELTSHN